MQASPTWVCGGRRMISRSEIGCLGEASVSQGFPEGLALFRGHTANMNFSIKLVMMCISTFELTFCSGTNYGSRNALRGVRPKPTDRQCFAFLRSTCGSSWFTAGPMSRLFSCSLWRRCRLLSMSLFRRSFVLACSDAVN